MIKNLTPPPVDGSSISSLLTQGTPASQDARLVEVYARSSDMYRLLDEEDRLGDYYTSERLDWVQRLDNETIFSPRKATMTNLLEKYNSDLVMVFDDASATLDIEFAYADAKGAQKIVRDIVKYAGEALNRFEKENAQTALKYLEKQAALKRKRFMDSIKKMIEYQNRHNMFSPTSDVERKSSILASLESLLVQKEVEYKSRLQYMNENASEMVMMRGDIENIKKRIKEIRSELASSDSSGSAGTTVGSASGDGTGEHELNRYVYDFELLKNQLDFNKQLYTQTLVKLEELKVQVSQNSKNVIVVTEASLPDEYRYPQKIKSVLSLFIMLFFIYGISVGVVKIIKDHKD
jgi:capsular polysaccharide transport system permease protein